MSLFEIKNLHVTFSTTRGKVEAVSNASFEIEENECVALVGESGCGKSVTARAIMGLTEATNGVCEEGSQILYKGQNILDFTESEWINYRGSASAMIFQDAMSAMNPTMRIGKQIAECFSFHKRFSKQEANEKSIELLKMVGIPDAEDAIKRYPHEFSGGMRQRVMIASALACNPKLLIADEPTTALDVTIQAQILDLISRLKEQNKMSVLLITHDMGVVAGLAQSVVVFYAGHVMEKGNVEEIFNDPKHPYTQGLLSASPRLDQMGKGRLYTINGAPPELIGQKTGCPFAERCPYADNKCRKTMPALENITNTHKVACYHQQEVK